MALHKAMCLCARHSKALKHKGRSSINILLKSFHYIQFFAYKFCIVEFMTNNPDLGEEPIDIEDLVNYGKTSGA